MSSRIKQIDALKALSAKLKANLHIQDEPIKPMTVEEERMMAALAKEDEPVVESEKQKAEFEEQCRKNLNTKDTKETVSIPKTVDITQRSAQLTKPLSYQVVVSDDGIHDFFTINEVYVPKGYNGATKSFCANIGYEKIRSFYSERPRLISKEKDKLLFTNIEISKEFIAACLVSMEFSTNKEFIKELPT